MKIIATMKGFDFCVEELIKLFSRFGKTRQGFLYENFSYENDYDYIIICDLENYQDFIKIQPDSYLIKINFSQKYVFETYGEEVFRNCLDYFLKNKDNFKSFLYKSNYYFNEFNFNEKGVYDFLRLIEGEKTIKSRSEKNFSQLLSVIDDPLHITCAGLFDENNLIGMAQNLALLSKEKWQNIKQDFNAKDFFEKGFHTVVDLSFSVHAEDILLTKYYNQINNDVALFVTLKPCFACMKKIYFAGIKTVYILEEFFDEWTLKFQKCLNDITIITHHGSTYLGKTN